MSQESVERLLGRLLTDAEFAKACALSVERACHAGGFVVSESELSALKDSRLTQLTSTTLYLDDRLKRAYGTMK